MKNILVIVFTSILLGCGGSTGDSSSQDESGFVGVEDRGSISFSFFRSSDTPNVAQKVLDDAAFVRVLIESASTSFRFIQDYAVPATVSDTITVPAATDYQVSAFSRNAGNRPLKFGETTGVFVTAGANTAVNMTLVPITATITVPASINSGSAFTVTTSTNSPNLLRDFKFVEVSSSPYTSDPNLLGENGSADSFNLNAPSSTTDSSAYFKSLWFIEDKYTLDTSDSFSSYRFHYPDISQQDPQVTTNLLALSGPSDGSISLNINYRPAKQ